MTTTGLNSSSTTARIPTVAPDCATSMPARAKPGQRRVEELEVDGERYRRRPRSRRLVYEVFRPDGDRVPVWPAALRADPFNEVLTTDCNTKRAAPRKPSYPGVARSF